MRSSTKTIRTLRRGLVMTWVGLGSIAGVACTAVHHGQLEIRHAPRDDPRPYDRAVGGIARGHEAPAMLPSWKTQPIDREWSLVELLGAPLARVSIVYFEKRRFSSFAEAAAEVESLLASVVLAPGHHDRPELSPSWAEGTFVSLEVELEYIDGSRGHLESSGRHIGFQDRHGTYWYHRWSLFFPRRPKGRS